MLAAKFIYPQGRNGLPIAVPASSKIAVQSQSPAQIFQRVGFPNFPNVLSLLHTLVANEEWVSSAFSAAAEVFIFAGSAPCNYSVGTDPRVLAQAAAQTQGAPGVLNATGTLTAAMILSGIVTSTTAAAVAATLDTGTVMDAAIDMNIGDSFDWTAIATGGNAFTVTASSGHTLVGAGVVASGSSGRFRTRKTAAATYVTYQDPTPIS